MIQRGGDSDVSLPVFVIREGNDERIYAQEKGDRFF